MLERIEPLAAPEPRLGPPALEPAANGWVACVAQLVLHDDELPARIAATREPVRVDQLRLFVVRIGAQRRLEGAAHGVGSDVGQHLASHWTS